MVNHFYQIARQISRRYWVVTRIFALVLVLPAIVGCAAQSQVSGVASPDVTESPPASIVASTTPLPASPTARLSTVTATPVSASATPQIDTVIPPTNVVTPEVIPPDDLMTPDAERYTLAVTYTLDSDFPEEYPQPEAGEKWIVVVATLTNVSSAALVLEDQALTLVDEEGNRYAPEAPDEFTTPPLVGATIEANTSYLGLVRYSVPETAEPNELIWCLQVEDDNCANAVTAVIP